MTQLKFYDCHVKHSEIWLVLPTPGSRSQQFELGKLPGCFFFNEWPEYEATTKQSNTLAISTTSQVNSVPNSTSPVDYHMI